MNTDEYYYGKTVGIDDETIQYLKDVIDKIEREEAKLPQMPKFEKSGMPDNKTLFMC